MVKTSIYRLKLAQTVKNFNSPNKTQTNGEKPQFTEQKLKQTVKNAKNGCTSTQPHKNRRNFKNSSCG